MGDAGQPGVPVQHVADGRGRSRTVAAVARGWSSSSSGISGSRSPLRVADMTPAGRSQRHAGVHRSAVADGGDRAAAAQMGDDRVAEVGYGVEDRLHGQAVEAVAAHTEPIDLLGQRQPARLVRQGVVEGEVSKQATWVASGQAARAASMLARSPGRCSGAQATRSVSASRTVSVMTVARTNDGPPCTTRCATASGRRPRPASSSASRLSAADRSPANGPAAGARPGSVAVQRARSVPSRYIPTVSVGTGSCSAAFELDEPGLMAREYRRGRGSNRGNPVCGSGPGGWPVIPSRSSRGPRACPADARGRRRGGGPAWPGSARPTQFPSRARGGSGAALAGRGGSGSSC